MPRFRSMPQRDEFARLASQAGGGEADQAAEFEGLGNHLPFTRLLLSDTTEQDGAA